MGAQILRSDIVFSYTSLYLFLHSTKGHILKDQDIIGINIIQDSHHVESSRSNAVISSRCAAPSVLLLREGVLFLPYQLLRSERSETNNYL